MSTSGDVQATPGRSSIKVEPFSTCARLECTRMFKPGSGFVPEVGLLYEQVRGTAVKKREPLSRFEVLSRELCAGCAHLANFAVHRTTKTLGLMASWARENEEQDLRHRERALSRRASALSSAAQDQDGHEINRVLATADKRKKRKHGGRLPRAERRKLAQSRGPVAKTLEKVRKKGKNKGNKKGKKSK